MEYSETNFSIISSRLQTKSFAYFRKDKTINKGTQQKQKICFLWLLDRFFGCLFVMDIGDNGIIAKCKSHRI